MKICYVAVDVVVPHFRGASTHVYELSKNLVHLGHEVYMISRRLTASQSEYEELNGIKVFRIYRGIIFPPPISSYLQLRGQRKAGLIDLVYRLYLFTIYALYAGIITTYVIKRNKIDVIIERETSFGAGAIASILTGRLMILEVIGPLYSALSSGRASDILAYTESMVPYKFRHKLKLVTAAVDTDLFRPNAHEGRLIRERYGLQDSKVVGYVGTFQPWHGVEELILAGQDLIKRYHNLRFLMVGPYYKEMEGLTSRLGIRGSFTFIGSVNYRDVVKFINASDILVAPYNPHKSKLRSKYGIGSPLKVFEYMACEKPSITTSISPITDVVQDRVNAILVPPGDVKSLREAISELMEDPDLAESIGIRAREDAVELYSWESLARKLEDIIKSKEDRAKGHRG